MHLLELQGDALGRLDLVTVGVAISPFTTFSFVIPRILLDE